VSGRELDVVKANLQSLEQQVKDSKIKEKKIAKKINVNCMNALKANQEILERIKQINLTRGEVHQEREVVVKRAEEDSADEIIDFHDTTEQSEEETPNNIPNEMYQLVSTLDNEVNQEIPKTIPRFQRNHYHKIKFGLKYVMDDIKNIFKRINELGITGKTEREKDIIELAFEYLTSRLRRHIAEKIGKDKNKTENPIEM
jgi:type III secretory pathway component EscV